MAHGGSSSVSRVAELSDRIRMDDAANIQFTSGTTGNPKVRLILRGGIFVVSLNMA